MSERNRTSEEVAGTICAELQESYMSLMDQIRLLRDIEYDLVKQVAKQNILTRFKEGRMNEL